MAGVAGKSGRKKGALSGTRFNVSERIAAMGCKPDERLVDIAKRAEGIDDALAARIYTDLLKYLAPQLKAVEHSGSVDGSINVIIYRTPQSEGGKQ